MGRKCAYADMRVLLDLIFMARSSYHRAGLSIYLTYGN